MRIYAIGDIHGCEDMFVAVHDKITVDLAAKPPNDYRIVHVGDYSDRGPDSAGVIGRLAVMSAEDPRVICLLGNHDALLVRFLSEPTDTGPTLLANGGDATLRSYGVTPSKSLFGGYDHKRLSRKLAEAMPPEHRDFIEHLKTSVQFGDYFFVHAGIRPGIPLDAQSLDDMIWIREEFLWDPRDHGVVVVHGHTPVTAPEVRPNRINIDTGAVYGGTLTCLVLEGTDYRFL